MFKKIVGLAFFIQVGLMAEKPPSVICKPIKDALLDVAFFECFTELKDLDTAYDPGFGKYALRFAGAPKNAAITVSLERLGASGKAAERRSSSFGDIHFVVSSRGYLPGEKITVTMSSKDGLFKEDYSFIPFPIVKSSKNKKLTVEASLISLPPATFYQFKFSGFKENEAIHFHSESEGEIVKNSFNFSKSTPFMFGPETLSKKGGHAQIVFKNSQGELVEMQLPWGEQLTEYRLGKKKEI